MGGRVFVTVTVTVSIGLADVGRGAVELLAADSSVEWMLWAAVSVLVRTARVLR